MSGANKKLGQRIREARIANGFSQEDLGDALSLTRSSVSLWEKGLSAPEQANLQTLADVLKVTPDYLLYGKGKPPTKTKQPDTGYRRDMIGRMQRLIDTGKFDDLVLRRSHQLIMEGKQDAAVLSRARSLKNGAKR